jgi:hypothetical protein
MYYVQSSVCINELMEMTSNVTLLRTQLPDSEFASDNRCKDHGNWISASVMKTLSRLRSLFSLKCSTGVRRHILR